jgi:hypothetical protein
MKTLDFPLARPRTCNLGASTPQLEVSAPGHYVVEVTSGDLAGSGAFDVVQLDPICQNTPEARPAELRVTLAPH